MPQTIHYRITRFVKVLVEKNGLIARNERFPDEIYESLNPSNSKRTSFTLITSLNIENSMFSEGQQNKTSPNSQGKFK